MNALLDFLYAASLPSDNSSASKQNQCQPLLCVKNWVSPALPPATGASHWQNLPLLAGHLSTDAIPLSTLWTAPRPSVGVWRRII